MADVDVYPRGQIALGSGDLMDVTNVKVDHSNGAKQIHTMRKKGAGISMGVEETSITYDTVVSGKGQERDYFALVKKGTIVQLRIKLPKETITVNGAYSQRSIELPLDDAIKEGLTFIGAMAD